MDPKAHWESIYGTKSTTDVSWYQREATLSIDLIRRAAPRLSAAVLDVGGGASTLVDSLVARHYTNITVLDIAANALTAAQARLGSDAGSVRWLVGDVLALDLPDHSIDVWHDRGLPLPALARGAPALRRTSAQGGKTDGPCDRRDVRGGRADSVQRHSGCAVRRRATARRVRH